MKILAVDSSAVVCSACLADGEKPIAITTLNTGNTHSETLLSSVDNLLSSASMSAQDVELFAVTTGPGSFTGIRIGTSLIKGLAFGGKKCVGVSTLKALAYTLIGLVPEGAIVCPVMDARRSQIYNALFCMRNGVPERLTPDRLIPIDELREDLQDKNVPIYLVGDGYDLVFNALADPRIVPIPVLWRMQNAYSVALAALSEYENGNVTDDRHLVPTYLRAPQAERERLERLANENQ